MTTIVTAFTDAGMPAEGLSPTIRIRRTDTQALVVTDAAMTEQGDGLYSYDFAQSPALKYAIRADGGNTLTAGERYVFGSIGPIEDDDLATSAVNKVRDSILADSTPFNGADIAAILTDTGLTIPALIAALNDISIADVQTAMTNQGYTGPRAALLDNLDATISSVLAAIAALNDPDAAAIADAVWDEPVAAHQSVGVMGAIYTRLMGKFITNPASGVNTIRDLGDTGNFATADIYEDVGESQPYQDQGINVRDEYT